MAEQIKDTGIGSNARVAYDLMKYVLEYTQDGRTDFKTKAQVLDLYEECLRATQQVRRN